MEIKSEIKQEIISVEHELEALNRALSSLQDKIAQEQAIVRVPILSNEELDRMSVEERLLAKKKRR